MFEQIATEYADGHYKALYGSSIRIIMRSEAAVLFVGHGVQLDPDRSERHYNIIHVCEKANREQLNTPKVREQIDAVFGEGAADMAILAATMRGRGTVLVNGGGEPLRLPSHVQRKIAQAQADEANQAANEQLDITPMLKTCVQCGSPLTPQTDSHHLDAHIGDHPRTLADCQKLTNRFVIGAHAFRHADKWGYVEHFRSWDGESYMDDTFCNTNCAANYGRRAARDLPRLEANGELIARIRRISESFDHYDVDEAERLRREQIEKIFDRHKTKGDKQ